MWPGYALNACYVICSLLFARDHLLATPCLPFVVKVVKVVLVLARVLPVFVLTLLVRLR